MDNYITVNENKVELNINNLNKRAILSISIEETKFNKQNKITGVIVIGNITLSDNDWTSNIIYMKEYQDLTTDELVLIIRRLYDMYKCTDIVLDTNGIGIAIYDILIQDIVDPTTGELYSALSCCNDKTMAERCKVDNAPKVIWSIKSKDSYRQFHVLLKSGLKQGKINLLVDEDEVKKFFNELNSISYVSTDYHVKLIDKEPNLSKSRYYAVGFNHYVQILEHIKYRFLRGR